MSAVMATLIPWPDHEPPREATLRRLLADEGLQPHAWSNGPGDVYAAHTHAYHKVIYVLGGTISFNLPEAAQHITLRAGDRLELPPGVVHEAVVGPRGVICLEAHRP
jgi:quercetin dioxygenase-like cupin family protein